MHWPEYKSGEPHMVIGVGMRQRWGSGTENDKLA
jgi:hypothetical protein